MDRGDVGHLLHCGRCLRRIFSSKPRLEHTFVSQQGINRSIGPPPTKLDIFPLLLSAFALPRGAVVGATRFGQGSLGYMPPEAIYDTVPCDVNHDSFAIGAMALVLLAQPRFRAVNMFISKVQPNTYFGSSTIAISMKLPTVHKVMVPQLNSSDFRDQGAHGAPVLVIHPRPWRA